ncbi:HNH endonuclease signature motif containing protein [Streptomyces sp. CBMAI 2042]|uniref:HNH endonuclease signature motif containing protein n=1 Tax=Streptomyces sp. CBMAI 2042 TaxID=2305222 RepID=UPI001F1F31BF|nr:HNH endonuclease signature motif containing protein [Streptomyces sp. CBMAI 2042]
MIERLMAKVVKETNAPAHRPDLAPCWIWTGYCNPFGHGNITLSAEEGRALVHRVTYQHAIGPIPKGLELDHLCRVPSCCNPAHLEAVTHAENVRRGRGGEAARARAATRTHCTNGHAYAGENYRITPLGRRRCRVCAREWASRKRTQMREGAAA